ncbi:MAG: exodeoxyribonuclease VII small subunit [Myxococcota bacterium]
MSARAKQAKRPSTSSKEAPAPVSFEAALEALEALVENLEGGGHSLEESLESFERGVRLVRVCSERLDAARLRLAELEQGPDGLREREIELGEDE